MAADLVISIATKIGEYLVAPVSCQFGYLIFYDRNIKNLETEVQNLEDTRDGMQRKVDEGKRKNETVEKVVERWLGEVDNLNEEAKKFLEDDVKANKGCMNGWCPNLKSRYSLSRKATKKTQDCVVGRIIPGVLSRLLKLEELYIGQSFDEWDVVEQDKEGANASIAELASLSNLVALKICVQLNDVKSWPKVLDLKKVKKFDLIICKPYPREGCSIEDRIFRSSSTDLYYDFCHFQNQLMFRDVDVRHLMETVLKNLLKRIRVLKLDSVKGSMNILSGLSRDDFAKLKKLEIINYGDLEYLINTTYWVSHTASDALDLEVLRLERLPALTYVWKGPTQLEESGIKSHLANLLPHLSFIKTTHLSALPSVVAPSSSPGKLQSRSRHDPHY
ncbi:hypothetical protein U1Q18_007709 [Sarracenia purpurea var. burkii]